MAKVKQKVYLISEQQRNALLNYLLSRPYREVAGGVEFLKDAPTTMLNIEVPDDKLESFMSKSESEPENNIQVEVIPSSTEQEVTVINQ